MFWTGSGVSIHNYDTNFWDLIKEGKISVHTTDISKLEGKTVHLENGETLDSDLVICATGWKKDPSFKWLGLDEAGLGLPYSEKEKAELNQKADETVLTMFPSLRDQPDLKPFKIVPIRCYAGQGREAELGLCWHGLDRQHVHLRGSARSLDHSVPGRKARQNG